MNNPTMDDYNAADALGARLVDVSYTDDDGTLVTEWALMPAHVADEITGNSGTLADINRLTREAAERVGSRQV